VFEGVLCYMLDVLCFMFGMLDVLDVWDVEYWMLRMNLDKFR
jgi:hypothetical protein